MIQRLGDIGRLGILVSDTLILTYAIVLAWVYDMTLYIKKLSCFEKTFSCTVMFSSRFANRYDQNEAPNVGRQVGDLSDICFNSAKEPRQLSDPIVIVVGNCRAPMLCKEFAMLLTESQWWRPEFSTHFHAPRDVGFSKLQAPASPDVTFCSWS